MANQPEHIFRFLPIKYPSVENGEYVDFWWNSYTENFNVENFHLAFLSFHMLYMTAVYFLLYKISKIYRPAYEHSLFHMGNEEESNYLRIDSAFSFVNMNEKAVFRFLKIAGADHSFIGEVSKFIEERNNASHAKGLIYFKDDADGLKRRAVDYVSAVEKIQNLFIENFKGVSQNWKVSKLNEFDLRLYLENEIAVHSLTPAEVKKISGIERVQRPKVSAILDDLIQSFFETE